MSRSLAYPASASSRRLLLSGGIALLGGVSAGLLLFVLTMSPPRDEVVAMAAYLAATGAASLAAGWLLMTRAESSRRLSLRLQVFLITVVGGIAGLLNVFIISQLMFVSTSHDLQVLIATLGFNVFVTAAFGVLVAASVSRQVEFVTGAVRSLAGGDYDQRLDATGGGELGSLAESVNDLAQRLQAAEEAQRALERERRELTVAVSHDLRTPLASMRAVVEALADGMVADAAEAHRYYAALRHDLDRLGRMVEDLFELTQIDAGAMSLQRSLLPLQEIAAEVVDSMQAQARLQDVELSLHEDGELPMALIDGPRIERAIANLLRNALEHTPSGGRVAVELSSREGWISLTVADSGEGIEEEQLSRIWQRFYRGEASRTRRANGGGDGAGLGLAIVRGFVEAHGGRVEVASALHQGSRFTIQLPAGQDAGFGVVSYEAPA